MALPHFRRWFGDPWRSPRRITLIYLAVGAVWIILSDRVLALVVQNPQVLTDLQTAKGWFWVALSALVIYLLVAGSVAALGRREHWFRALIEQAQGLVLVVDPATVVQYASPSGREVLGRDAPALVGTRCLDWMHPDDVPAFRGAWDALIAAPGAQALVEVRCRQGDDESWRVLEIAARNLSADPVVAGIVLDAHDVTERRRLQHHLSRVEHLEAVGQLSAGVAHDFNNVLSVVLANAELVQSEGGSMPPDQQARLDDVIAAARGGAQMVHKLLGFSRHAAILRAPHQLRPIVEETVGLARRLIPETINLELEADAAAGWVRVDPTAIQQILLNLVTNARDAMPTGGRVQIAVGDAVLDARYIASHPWAKPGRYVRVVVADTGAGMDQATRARAFEPFFTTKPSGIGTGLGLAMVYGLVKQHQGFVDLASTPGQGTTVTLHFPAAEVGAEPAGAEAEAAPGPTGRQAGTFLLVEDDESLLRTARRALESFGYTVVTATNGEEALRILEARAQDFDLVISDVVLPKLGGPDLYRVARGRGLKARFLFASGYAARQALGDLEAEPGVRFLRKPWTLEELRAAIRKTLAA